MAHFILVHGMFHGGWCWDRVKARLEAAGHTVEAPDLAGCGTDPTPPLAATLALWAGDIARRAAAATAPAVLVGHSRGGMVISQAAELVPDSVAALVYLTALMLPNGVSALTLSTVLEAHGIAAERATVVPQMNPSGTAWVGSPELLAALYATCDDADRAWALPQVGPEPFTPLATPIGITPDRYGRIPRIFIEAEADRVLPISLQRGMIALSPPAEVLNLPADHMPILTHVAEVAGMLDGIAGRYAGPAG